MVAGTATSVVLVDRYVFVASVQSMRTDTERAVDTYAQNSNVYVQPGTTTGRLLRDAVTRAGATAQLVPVKDHPEGLALLESKGADAYASDRVILIARGRVVFDGTPVEMQAGHASLDDAFHVLTGGEACAAAM